MRIMDVELLADGRASRGLFVLSICLEFVAVLCLRMSKSETKTFQSGRKPRSLAVDVTSTVNLVRQVFHAGRIYRRDPRQITIPSIQGNKSVDGG